MSPTPWYIFTNVFAIVVYLLCTLAVGLASGVVVWALRRIDKTVAPAMASLVAMEKPLAKMVETLDAVSAASSELKELKDGDLRIMQQQVKSITELRMVVEEFHAALFAEKPEPRRPRRAPPTGTDEQAEILAEKRGEEARRNGEVANIADLLENRAKHGGVV